MSNVALAALPILLLLALMIGLRWSTAKAGLSALAATLVIALAAFGFGKGELGQVRALTGAFAEAGFSTATIAWILLPALAIHHLQQRTGSIALLQDDVLARLLTFPNVLVTSHQAFLTREALAKIASTTQENVAELDRGAVLSNEVRADNVVASPAG